MPSGRAILGSGEMRWTLLILPVLLAACSEPSAEVIDKVIDGPLSGDRAISASDAGGGQLSSVGSDGFRVLIEPSFGRYRYYLSFRQLPSGCLLRARQRRDGSDSGRVCGPGRIHVRRIDQNDGQVLTAEFFIPGEEADTLLEDLDARLTRWRGTDTLTYDGTGVSLERVRNGSVISIDTNHVGPDNPASQLLGDLQRILLAYGPSGFAPRSGNWSVRSAEPEDDLCNHPELATPLNRGFGVGDSDCDASKRWSK